MKSRVMAGFGGPCAADGGGAGGTLLLAGVVLVSTGAVDAGVAAGVEADAAPSPELCATPQPAAAPVTVAATITPLTASRRTHPPGSLVIRQRRRDAGRPPRGGAAPLRGWPAGEARRTRPPQPPGRARRCRPRGRPRSPAAPRRRRR